MQVIMKEPCKSAKVGVLSDLRSMRKFVGGTVGIVPLLAADGSTYFIVCNDNFLNDGSAFNMSLGVAQIFGNFFICKEGIVNPMGERDFVGLTTEDVRAISDCLGWNVSDIYSLESWLELASFFDVDDDPDEFPF